MAMKWLWLVPENKFFVLLLQCWCSKHCCLCDYHCITNVFWQNYMPNYCVAGWIDVVIVFLYHSTSLPLVAVIDYIEEPPYKVMQYWCFQRFNKDINCSLQIFRMKYVCFNFQHNSSTVFEFKLQEKFKKRLFHHCHIQQSVYFVQLFHIYN